MDCILYIDLLFLWNFWMNALVLFVERQIIRTYRTIPCLLAAILGALTVCAEIVLYINNGANIWFYIIGTGVIAVMNMMAFGAKKLLWHLLLYAIICSSIAGVFLFAVSHCNVEKNEMAIVATTVTAFLFCALLERNTRIRWKEEHMKAKTVMEFGDRKLFATALMDTGNKLYDPFFHKPVILVDEKMMGDMVAYCRVECPEKFHLIPFHSIGKENGMLEAITFDSVSIMWQEKKLNYKNVIAASTKESLYKGKEYQVIFHCGLLQEG